MPSVRHYPDILVGTFMIRQLQPWTEDIKKTQVKAPKIYFRDNGIFHYLLGIRGSEDLLYHPKLGASWGVHLSKSYAITKQILKIVIFGPFIDKQSLACSS